MHMHALCLFSVLARSVAPSTSDRNFSQITSDFAFLQGLGLENGPLGSTSGRRRRQH
jgi:hypothetical protein